MDSISEILSAHAEQLNRGGTGSPEILGDASPPDTDLGALMDTAVRVKRGLTPVRIAPAFRARLHDGLTMAAQHKESQSILLGRREPSWGWLIGAAALGSAAGLIAMAWRARHSPRAVAESRLEPEIETPQAALDA